MAPFVGAWIQANLSFSIHLPSMFVQKYLRMLCSTYTRSFLKFAGGVEVHYEVDDTSKMILIKLSHLEPIQETGNHL